MSERTILEKLIADGKDAEAKLVELDKPKYRRGAFGTAVRDSKKLWWVHDGTKACPFAGSDHLNGFRYGDTINLSDIKTYGNIEDLCMGGDLNQYRIDACGGGTLAAQCVSRSQPRVQFTIGSGGPASYATATLLETEVFHQKLGQIIATAKRNEKA